MGMLLSCSLVASMALGSVAAEPRSMEELALWFEEIEWTWSGPELADHIGENTPIGVVSRGFGDEVQVGDGERFQLGPVYDVESAWPMQVWMLAAKGARPLSGTDLGSGRLTGQIGFVVTFLDGGEAKASRDRSVVGERLARLDRAFGRRAANAPFPLRLQGQSIRPIARWQKDDFVIAYFDGGVNPFPPHEGNDNKADNPYVVAYSQSFGTVWD